MKSSLIPLVIILSCILEFSSCNRQKSTNTLEIISYDYVLNNDEVKSLLKDNTQSNKIIKVCNPIYFMQIDFEQMSASQYGLLPFD